MSKKNKLQSFMILLVTLTILACSSENSLVCSDSEPGVERIVQPKQLVGQWNVALFFSPDKPPSETTMVISDVNADGTLSGSFYQTEFTQARYTQQGGCIVFTVITADESGPYATSGKMCDESNISGQTLSAGRNFLMAWQARKIKQ